MRRVIIVVAGLAVLLPTLATAQVRLALRFGPAGPLGHSVHDVSLSDTVEVQFPVQLDALWRFTPEWAAGLYGAFGVAKLNGDLEEACDLAGASCSVNVVRIGVLGTFTFTHPTRPFIPWVGVGFGLEWLDSEIDVAGSPISATTRGNEFFNFQLGGEYEASDRFAFGPYFMMSFCRYMTVDGEEIDGKSNHVWLGFGLRGRYDL
jgi:hypothetical protein